jgi:MFS family permease
MKQASPIVRAADLGSEAESEPTVATPLLQSHTSGHNNKHASRGEPGTIPQIHHHHKNHPQFARVLLIVTASLFFVSISDYMQRAPWMRVVEDNVCRNYYKMTLPTEFDNPYEPIPEERCKVPDVQAKLAMLRGWDQMFGNIPSIITAVPYGIMADKYGRKPVIVLCLTGLLMGLAWIELVGYYSNFFAIEWYWFQNAFMFIGGGSPVARSMYFTILADVASEERR